jgi:hypothetical protein
MERWFPYERGHLFVVLNSSLLGKDRNRSDHEGRYEEKCSFVYKKASKKFILYLFFLNNLELNMKFR